MWRQALRIQSRRKRTSWSPGPPDDGGWRQTFILLFAIAILSAAVAVTSILKTVSDWEARAESVPASVVQAADDRRAVSQPLPTGAPESPPP